MRPLRVSAWVALLVWGGAVLATPRPVRAHCDTMDGPVVTDAQAALSQGDVTPVLKWVRPDREAEIRAAFRQTLVVRTKGPEARALADRYFFETLVRIHRAGEGAPYTGLKPAGSDSGPAVAAADKALESGSVDAVVDLVTQRAAAGIRRRFAHAAEARTHAADSPEAGRRFVAHYVEFVHYVERLYENATQSVTHHGHPTPGQAEEHEGHS